MVSTQDFAHQVWQSLENIRECLAVLETEVRHARHDLMRLENGLISHTAGHHHPPAGGGPKPGRGSAANDGDGNGATINIRISRRALGGGGVVGGGLVAGLIAAGKALGWW